MLMGLRGVTDTGWDWESAVSYSTAEAEDVDSTEFQIL